VTCKCHSGLLYASLVTCPKCGHGSLDRIGNWEGCERRRCGYEHVYDGTAPAETHVMGPGRP
jgi:hypothetical protein